jgi:hypothetical protein
MDLDYLIYDDITYVYNITSETVQYLQNIISENTRELRITGDYLNHFDIPIGVKTVHLSHMGLNTLSVPEGVEELYCNYNFLRTIDLPSTLVFFEARNNLLTNINFADSLNLEYIDIRMNRFKYLNFDIDPNKLEFFNASLNAIEYVSPQLSNFFSQLYIPPESRSNTPDDLDSEYRFTKFL